MRLYMFFLVASFFLAGCEVDSDTSPDSGNNPDTGVPTKGYAKSEVIENSAAHDVAEKAYISVLDSFSEASGIVDTMSVSVAAQCKGKTEPSSYSETLKYKTSVRKTGDIASQKNPRDYLEEAKTLVADIRNGEAWINEVEGGEEFFIPYYFGSAKRELHIFNPHGQKICGGEVKGISWDIDLDTVKVSWKKTELKHRENYTGGFMDLWVITFTVSVERTEVYTVPNASGRFSEKFTDTTKYNEEVWFKDGK